MLSYPTQEEFEVWFRQTLILQKSITVKNEIALHQAMSAIDNLTVLELQLLSLEIENRLRIQYQKKKDQDNENIIAKSKSIIWEY